MWRNKANTCLIVSYEHPVGDVGLYNLTAGVHSSSIHIVCFLIHWPDSCFWQTEMIPIANPSAELSCSLLVRLSLVPFEKLKMLVSRCWLIYTICIGSNLTWTESNNLLPCYFKKLWICLIDYDISLALVKNNAI